jgi:hypothetical protein
LPESRTDVSSPCNATIGELAPSGFDSYPTFDAEKPPPFAESFPASALRVTLRDAGTAIAHCRIRRGAGPPGRATLAASFYGVRGSPSRGAIMRSRFHASYPALLLTLTHFGCSGEMGGPGEAVATESFALSSNISWTSSAMLVDPANAAWASVKDPTVVYHNGKYHVYATIYNTSVSQPQTSTTPTNMFNAGNPAIKGAANRGD